MNCLTGLSAPIAIVPGFAIGLVSSRCRRPYERHTLDHALERQSAVDFGSPIDNLAPTSMTGLQCPVSERVAQRASVVVNRCPPSSLGSRTLGQRSIDRGALLRMAAARVSPSAHSRV